MLVQRRSDQVIHLFDDHKDAEEFTVGQALGEQKELVIAARENRDYFPPTVLTKYWLTDQPCGKILH